MQSPAIDGYTIDRPIGRNPFGKLYAATRLGQPCVLALLDTGDAAANQKYLARAQRMASVTHPGLIPIVDSGWYPEGFFIAWESPPGTDLRSAIDEKRFVPFERKLIAIARLCEALNEAHTAGIVHRNVEPRHIFTSESGDLKLGHFVFMESGRLQLSPYSSPELLHSGSKIDGRSDQFSLACVLYEWLTGFPPFHGAHGHSVLASIVSEPHTPIRKRLPACDEELEQILDRALAKRPNDRFATCLEFGDALQRFCSRLPALAQALLEGMSGRRSAMETGTEALRALLPNYDKEQQSSFPQAVPEESDYGLLLEWHAEADRYLQALRDPLRSALPALNQLKTAYELFQRGDFAACESHLHEVLSAAPNYAPARRLLDHCARGRNSALRRNEYAVRMPKLIDQLRSALDRDQPSLALTAAGTILEFDPAHPQALAVHEQATRRLNQADQERKQKIKELLETCRARLRTGQYDAALKASEELLKLAPESGFALSALQLDRHEDVSGDGER